ncbi:MAG: cytochrome c [Acidobacteriota bacterium]|nr:cytochrome c [Acidobacteriota bacterium]
MAVGTKAGWSLTLGTLLFGAAIAGVVTPLAVKAEQAAPAPEVTFTKDIAPILQRSCQNCHRPGQVAPMSLITYEEARPWARAMKQRTALRDKFGAMPPWYIEKNIGIQHYKHDPSLSDEEVAKVAKWADTGAPRGNPADLPPPISFPDGASWHAGEPDLIVESPEITVKANTPDWWGEFEPTKIPLTEDRYVASVEIREVNDFAKDASGRDTVGQRYVWHHLIWATAELTGDGDPIDASIADGAVGWPVHEVGRNADVFEPNAGRLLKANSSIVYQSAHLHAGGADVKSKLLFGFKFHPKGYKPARRSTLRSLGNGLDIDIKPNEANQQLHAYMVLQQPTKIATFEPHLHAPGQRMCLEAIWGINIQTLTCAGYDHNWVRQYEYDDDHAPLLPRGTILHIIGYMDNTPNNKNIPDPRNWQGSGNRSIANMFIDLGQSVPLTDDQFQEEMAERRRKLGPNRPDVIIGCPLCNVIPPPAKPTAQQQ